MVLQPKLLSMRLVHHTHAHLRMALWHVRQAPARHLYTGTFPTRHEGISQRTDLHHQARVQLHGCISLTPQTIKLALQISNQTLLARSIFLLCEAVLLTPPILSCAGTLNQI